MTPVPVFVFKCSRRVKPHARHAHTHGKGYVYIPREREITTLRFLAEFNANPRRPWPPFRERCQMGGEWVRSGWHVDGWHVDILVLFLFFCFSGVEGLCVCVRGGGGVMGSGWHVDISFYLSRFCFCFVLFFGSRRVCVCGVGVGGVMGSVWHVDISFLFLCVGGGGDFFRFNERLVCTFLCFVFFSGWGGIFFIGLGLGICLFSFQKALFVVSKIERLWKCFEYLVLISRENQISKSLLVNGFKSCSKASATERVLCIVPWVGVRRCTHWLRLLKRWRQFLCR